eukprot:10570095-Alexandrium_andersonii.AAC.1
MRARRLVQPLRRRVTPRRTGRRSSATNVPCARPRLLLPPRSRLTCPSSSPRRWSCPSSNPQCLTRRLPPHGKWRWGARLSRGRATRWPRLGRGVL